MKDVMNAKTRRIFALYFHDHFEHLAVLTVGLPLFFVIALVWKGWNPLWLIFPGIVVLNYLILSKYFGFYSASKRDVIDGKAFEKKVTIDKIAVTPTHNMRSKFGGVRGAERLTLITTEGEKFFVTADKGEIPAIELEMFMAITANMTITYLPSTNFVVGMDCKRDYVDSSRGFSAFRALWHYNTADGENDSATSADFGIFGVIRNAKEALAKSEKINSERINRLNERDEEERRILKMSPDALADLSDDELFNAAFLRVIRTSTLSEDSEYPADCLENKKNVFEIIYTFAAEATECGIAPYLEGEGRYAAPYLSEALRLVGAAEHKALFDRFVYVYDIDLYNVPSLEDCEGAEDFDEELLALPELREILVGFIRNNITEF